MKSNAAIKDIILESCQTNRDYPDAIYRGTQGKGRPEWGVDEGPKDKGSDFSLKRKNF